MRCYSLSEGKLTRGFSSEDFYAPSFSGNIKDASIRIITGGSWDLTTLSEAIKHREPHALLCCLVELIPPTGNSESQLFPEGTCLLSAPVADTELTLEDKSVLFASEGYRFLYGCRPGETFIRVGDKQIINDQGTLKLEAPAQLPAVRDPYIQYKGQDINVLELL